MSQPAPLQIAQCELCVQRNIQATASPCISEQRDMAVVQELELDRTRSNPNFQCWRLSRGGEDESRASLRLPNNVSAASEGSYDYLHARTLLLDNHLRAEGDKLYAFLEGSDAVRLAQIGSSNAVDAIVAGKLSLNMEQLLCCQIGSTVIVISCAGIARPQPADINQTTTHDPPLDQSMAKVERRNADDLKGGCQFLISSGSGDLVLVDASGPAERTAPPLKVTKIDGRPFCIGGAWQARPGEAMPSHPQTPLPVP